MNEIITLNRRVCAESKGKPATDEGTLLSREEGPDLWRGYSLDLTTEAEAVHAELNRLIPDDFGYTLFLGEERPSLTLEFEDGAVMGSSDSLEIQEHLSMQGQLGAMNWDEQRTIGMKKCQIWDQLKERATRGPARFIATKQLQRVFRGHLKEWIKEKRRDHSKVFVLMCRGDEESVDEELTDEEFGSLEEFERGLHNVLVMGFEVIGVVADGKPLPAKRIDLLKAATFKMMKEHMPISYGRATGSLGFDSLQEEDGDEH